MAGHSKWANIKHKKDRNDAAKSNVFAKMSRLITTAVQEGGGIGDPEKNVKLRLAVERARTFNMPKDNIARAIDKGMGNSSAQMHELVYEAFGSSGSAMIITAITDKSTRTVSDIKSILDKNGGKFASPGAVAHLFSQCGYIELDRQVFGEEQMYDVFDALEGIDIEELDDVYSMYIPFQNVGKVASVIGSVAGDSQVKVLDVVYRPHSPIEVSVDEYTKVEHLMRVLDDNDDVQNVYVNVYTSSDQ